MTCGILTIAAVTHLGSLLCFIFYYRRLREKHKQPDKSGFCYLLWRPYFNQSETLCKIRSKFRYRPPNIVEKPFLYFLAIVPYINLFNTFIIRLIYILLPFGLLYIAYYATCHNRRLKCWIVRFKKYNYPQVDVRMLLLLTTAIFFHWLLHGFPNSRFIHIVAIAFAFWRLPCLLLYNLATVFFQYYGIYREPVSMVRSLILLFFGYLEIILWFSILYLSYGWIELTNCGNALHSPINSFYFSAVTITTLGYGDFRPRDEIGRLFVSFEVIFGVVYVLLVIGDYIQRISSRVSREDEDNAL